MEFVDYKCLESLLIEGEELIAEEGLIKNLKAKKENKKKINALWVDLNAKSCKEIAKLFVENFSEPKFKSKLISGNEGKTIVENELQYFKEDGDVSINNYVFTTVNGIYIGIMPRDPINKIGCNHIIAAIDCVDRTGPHKQADMYYKTEICKMILHL